MINKEYLPWRSDPDKKSPLWSCKISYTLKHFDFFTLFEIIQEDEETERVKYNALLDEEDEANEAKFKEKDPEKDGNDSAYASKVGNYNYSIWAVQPMVSWISNAEL